MMIGVDMMTVIAGCILCDASCVVDATIWRDTCQGYFQKYNKMPIPDCD